MSQGNKKRIIVVLGMHRSGTSAITRGLSVLKVDLGNNLMPAFPGNNDTGFWEDKDIFHFNEELLKKLKCNWHGVRILDKDVLLNTQFRSEHDWAVKLLKEKIRPSDCFGFKDPRTTILLPFWQKVFSKLKIEDCYLISLRNPLSVAESLSRRDGLDLEKSVLIWIKHFVDAIRHSQGKKRVVVDYDLLLDSPKTQLERVSKALKLPCPDKQIKELEEYTREFLSKGLRHNTATMSDLKKNKAIPPFVQSAYFWLSKLARDKAKFGSSDFKKAWRNIEETYHEFSALYGYFDQLDLDREKLNAALEQANFEREQLKAEHDGQITNLNQAITERVGEISGLNQTVAERDRQIHQILFSNSWRLTLPFRLFRRNLIEPFYRFVHRKISASTSVLWRKLPLSYQIKQKLKNSLFTRLPFVFRGTQAYGRWYTLNAPTSISTIRDFPKTGPLVSVVVPVYNAEPRLLEAMVMSVRSQAYENWELILWDDGSPQSECRQTLENLAKSDMRIQIFRGIMNKGISGATNAAVAEARGKFVTFLDQDDLLHANALAHCVLKLQRDSCLDVVYTDQDKVDDQGSRFFEPFHKPAWSPIFLRGVMYVGHLLMVRRALYEVVGGCNSDFDGVQDFELMLRISEHTDRIAHIPLVLYHWRATQGSLALSSDAKGKIIEELQTRAVENHLKRLGLAGYPRQIGRIPHRVTIDPPTEFAKPSVSIIIPTRDNPHLISRCLGTIFEKTDYPDFEVIVVDNGTTNIEALEILNKFHIIKIDFPEKFNYSKANNLGVAQAIGEYVVLLNNDIEILDPHWLSELVYLIAQPGIAMVGPLLIYPNETVQHAGVALGLRGTADHIMRGITSDSDGYFGALSVTREVMAVTGACAILKRDRYLKIGGMNEYFTTHYQDVDLCLRVCLPGERILFTPRTRLIHHESATRGRNYNNIDRALLRDKWGELLSPPDRFNNPIVPVFSDKG